MIGKGVGFRHSVSEFLLRIHVDYVKELLPSNKKAWPMSVKRYRLML
jgi:hypothetical protein